MNVRSKMDINHLVTKEQTAVKHTSRDVHKNQQETDNCGPNGTVNTKQSTQTTGRCLSTHFICHIMDFRDGTGQKYRSNVTYYISNCTKNNMFYL